MENQLEQTRKQLVDHRSKPITEQNKELLQELEQRETTLQAEQTALQAQIKTDYPDYYALRYPKPVTLTDLQQKVLQPGEFLLIYHVMKDATLLWVVSKEQFGLYPLAVTESALTAKIEEFRKAMTEPILDAIAQRETLPRLRRIAQRSIGDISRLSAELSDLLMPAAMRPLLANAQTLYIVPTGAMYGLPFEALTQTPTPIPSQEGNAARLLSGEEAEMRFLIEDHAIAYLSSASLLNIIREAEQRRQDAAFPECSTNSTKTAPHPAPRPKCGPARPAPAH